MKPNIWHKHFKLLHNFIIISMLITQTKNIRLCYLTVKGINTDKDKPGPKYLLWNIYLQNKQWQKSLKYKLF